MFWRVLRNQILWLGLFSIVVLGVAFFLVLQRWVESSFTEQLLRQQQLLGKAEASNIMSYFQSFGNSVSVLAQLSSMEYRDDNTVSDMDTFVEQRRKNGIIGGVMLTDKYGVVQFHSSVLGTRDLGQSVADRDYFVWAKDQAEEGEYFISEPIVSRLEASVDETIIVVASPVHQNSVFTGVIASSVKLTPLLERFIGLMKVSNLDEVYMVDGQGNLMYSNSTQHAVGSHISKLFSDDQTLSDKIDNALSATREGQLKTEIYLITFTPVLLGNQKWLLIISTPVQEVADLTAPFYVRQVALLILTSFTILLFGVMAMRKNQA